MSNNSKNSFILYTENIEQVAMLSDEQAGQVFKAIFAYAAGQDAPAFESDLAVKLMFSIFKGQLDKNAQRYNAVCEKRRAAGKMGGRPRKTEAAESEELSGTKDTYPDSAAEPYTGKTAETTDAPQECSAPAESCQNDETAAKAYKTVSPAEKPAFIPPEPAQVEEYCRELGKTIDAKKFVDYYAANGWMIGKNRMKDWKAAVRYWVGNERGQSECPAAGSSVSSGKDIVKKDGSLDLDEIEKLIYSRYL